MIAIDNFDVAPVSARGAYLAIGNFDGVHRGHAHLIGRLRARAELVGAPALALTFDPHPVSLLRPEHAPVPLLWTERKAKLLQSVGANEVGVFQTGPWLLDLTAREFFDRVIVGQLGARGMVEGPNFGFGRDRGGDSTLLAQWCAEAGLAFEVDTATEADGLMVSSSRIRQALTAGDLAEANAMLGRPHRIRGFVTHGAARGRGLGFPTANLDQVDTLIPADGVYATLAWLPGATVPIPAATNIGPNPTFGEQIRKVEAHLLDYSGDLYDSVVELDFIERLRGTRKFSGLDDLLDQIGQDIERVRTLTARPPLPGERGVSTP